MSGDQLKRVESRKMVRKEMTRLSSEQRTIIRDTYKYLKEEANKNGLGLFVRLFSEFPQYKHIWPQFRSVPDSALISSDQLKNHAAVYMKGLQCIVERIEEEGDLEEQMRAIARSHAKWNIYKYHIEHMTPALLEVLNICMDYKMTPEVAEAWSTLYDIIGNLINQQKQIARVKPTF